MDQLFSQVEMNLAASALDSNIPAESAEHHSSPKQEEVSQYSVLVVILDLSLLIHKR